MFCSFCGSYLKPIYRYCSICGSLNPNYIQKRVPIKKLSKNDLLEWQKLVIYNSPNYLVYNSLQLYEYSKPVVYRNLEILNDSTRLVNSTSNPETFFERLNLLYEKLYFLAKLEPYCNLFTGSPINELTKLCSQEDYLIRAFIDRYFYNVSAKASKLKSVRGKINAFQTFYDILDSHNKQLSNDNNKHWITLYTKATTDIKEGAPPTIAPITKIHLSCKNYNVNTIEGIKAIPNTDTEAMQQLQQCASIHKKNGDLFLGIECLRKSIEISDNNSSEHLSEKQYLRLLDFAKLTSSKNLYDKELNYLRDQHPEFWDKRQSNITKMQLTLSRAKKDNIDLIHI